MSSPRRSTPPVDSSAADIEAGTSSGPISDVPVDSIPSMSADSASPPDSGDARPRPEGTAPTDPSPLPRIPWTGRVPTFFVMGPNGTLIPQFGPSAPPPRPAATSPLAAPQLGEATDASAAPTASPTQSAGIDAAARTVPRPNVLSMPGLTPFFPMFLNHMFAGPRERRPDPEAAAELLRSIPTVEKGLFRRVERVIIAEQVQDGNDGEEKGWKCGICLEGVEEGAKETGVKVLQCNHLFHGDCLEPWLTTNHTCPTCRLDLDPMKTLRRNPNRASGRPAATGSGRQSPHPYARGDAAAPVPADMADQGNDTGDGPNITFFWHIPPPPQPGPAPVAVPSGAVGADQSASDPPATIPAPQTPTMTFGFPFHASPLPLHNAPPAGPVTNGTSPGVTAQQSTSSQPSTNTAPTASSNAQEQAQQQQPAQQHRNHITVIHHHHPNPNFQGSAPQMTFPSVGIMPIRPQHAHTPPPGSPAGSPNHHHHHHHHHHHVRSPGVALAESTPGTPTRIPDTIPSGSYEADTASPNENANVDTVGRAATGPTASNAENVAPSEAQPSTGEEATGTEEGSNNRPHFHFFFNITDGPPLGVPGMPGAVGEPAGPPGPEAPPAPPIERPSLESWVKTREKALGWRCDAPDCGVAPTEDDEDAPMPTECEKEMLSIYSALQPAVKDAEYEDKKGFELHACEHRWHRTCLESVERCAGRFMKKDDAGRVWVRCETCRKDGWIWPTSKSPSEGEVERLCEAS